VTDGIATLSLEPDAPGSRRWSAAAPDTSAGLREYVLGPENGLVTQGIGLRGAAAGADSLHIECIPLTVWAPSGLGKSQLLRALAATWARDHAPDSVALLSGADFARSYAAAVKVDDLPRFQQRYQRVDFLLIDDLDGLQSKQGAQQQLATIVDHRQRHQRPVVFSVKQPLHRLGLSSRLTSRLAGGLVIPLQLPSAETRRAILQRLCQQRQLDLTPEAARLLSASESLTVPQLMGLLNQLRHESLEGSTPELTEVASASFVVDPDGVPSSPQEAAINAAQVQQFLGASQVLRVDAAEIIRATARYFGLQPRNLTGSSRRRMDVLARSCAMYLMRGMTGESFQQIGRHFGGRDHSTVMHACRKVAGNQETEMTTRTALQEIQRRLSEWSLSRAEDEPHGAGGRRPKRAGTSRG
jgi:chromosomal replication initiator protein